MQSDRREFLKSAGVVTLGVAGVVAASKVIADNSSPDKLGSLTQHKLPELPYDYDALEPYIDEATMKLHHDIHHKAYVDGLNKAEGELAAARASGDFSTIEFWSKKSAFHGGGHFLHSLFWQTLAPASNGPKKGIGGGVPTGALASKISEDFGSFESFKKHFAAAALAVEGAGWAILQRRNSDNRLLILQAENQHKLTNWDSVPLLALDVWEHAYYLKYQNKRKDYIEAWWNVVNWKEVQTRFESTSGTKISNQNQVELDPNLDS